MADYWIKLYHEIIDDPKMATLPDRLWRRSIELFLLAGKLCPDKSGKLPDTRQLAWLLRMNTDELAIDLSQLSATGIVESIPNGWLVVNFEKRQQAVPTAERVKQHRERKQRQQYADVTPEKRNVTESRLTETETEIEIEGEEEPPAAFLKPEIALIREITGLIPDISTQDKVVNNVQTCRKRLGYPPRDALAAELKTIWEGWCATKTKDGRPYNPANWDWTERAATGYNPAPVNGNSKKVRILTGPNGEKVEEKE